MTVSDDTEFVRRLAHSTAARPRRVRWQPRRAQPRGPEREGSRPQGLQRRRHTDKVLPVWGGVCFTLCSWNVGESLTVCSSTGDLDRITFWTNLHPLCSPITLSDPRPDAPIPHPPSDQPGHPRSRTAGPLWLEGRNGQALERRLGRGG